MALKDVIVFFHGGVTYEEAMFINRMNENPSEFNLPPGSRVIVGGSYIHNSKTLVFGRRINRENERKNERKAKTHSLNRFLGEMDKLRQASTASF